MRSRLRFGHMKNKSDDRFWLARLMLYDVPVVFDVSDEKSGSNNGWWRLTWMAACSVGVDCPSIVRAGPTRPDGSHTIEKRCICVRKSAGGSFIWVLENVSGNVTNWYVLILATLMIIF